MIIQKTVMFPNPIRDVIKALHSPGEDLKKQYAELNKLFQPASLQFPNPTKEMAKQLNISNVKL